MDKYIRSSLKDFGEKLGWATVLAGVIWLYYEKFQGGIVDTFLIALAVLAFFAALDLERIVTESESTLVSLERLLTEAFLIASFSMSMLWGIRWLAPETNDNTYVFWTWATAGALALVCLVLWLIGLLFALASDKGAKSNSNHATNHGH